MYSGLRYKNLGQLNFLCDTSNSLSSRKFHMSVGWFHNLHNVQRFLLINCRIISIELVDLPRPKPCDKVMNNDRAIITKSDVFIFCR